MILLVVDAQEMLMNDKLYNFNLFKENVEKLITHARKCGVEVVFVRHDDGTELTKGAKGFEVYNSFAPKDGEKIFDKNYNSAFRKTGLTEYLRGKNENEIMIAGLQTDYCMDALDFLKQFADNSIDFVLYDPPYSPRQVSECYKKLGKTVNMQTTQASFWGNLKKEIARITKPDGIVISFGWNTNGIGKTKGFEIIEILTVAHGGQHNDTICTVERKSRTLF